jgi:hypothetical protein
MIYCDKMGHLISDTSLEELHIFATSIGLKRSWFQGASGGGKFPHYDLTTDRMRSKAVIHGAKLIHSKDIVKKLLSCNYTANRGG